MGDSSFVLTASHDQVVMCILTEEYSWQRLLCSALSISATDRLTTAVKKIVSHFNRRVALKGKQEQMKIDARKLINSWATIGVIAHTKCLSAS